MQQQRDGAVELFGLGLHLGGSAGTEEHGQDDAFQGADSLPFLGQLLQEELVGGLHVVAALGFLKQRRTTVVVKGGLGVVGVRRVHILLAPQRTMEGEWPHKEFLVTPTYQVNETSRPYCYSIARIVDWTLWRSYASDLRTKDSGRGFGGSSNSSGWAW